LVEIPARTGLTGLAAIRSAFIDLAVTVIVLAIANLLAWGGGTIARPPFSAETDLLSLATFTDGEAARTFGAFFADAIGFVDLAVAVIVFAIAADLAPPRIDAGVLVVAVLAFGPTILVVVGIDALSALAKL